MHCLIQCQHLGCFQNGGGGGNWFPAISAAVLRKNNQGFLLDFPDFLIIALILSSLKKKIDQS